MLDKVIMLPFTMFIIFLFAFFAVTGMAMFTQWNMVQNQAQFVASSMGKWGGYTAQAENTVRAFADRIGLSRDDVDVEVSSRGPVSWGTPVWARITIPFEFKVGKYTVGTYDISGLGRSVSSYLPGGYGVSYASP